MLCAIYPHCTRDFHFVPEIIVFCEIFATTQFSLSQSFSTHQAGRDGTGLMPLHHNATKDEGKDKVINKYKDNFDNLSRLAQKDV